MREPSGQDDPQAPKHVPAPAPGVGRTGNALLRAAREKIPSPSSGHCLSRAELADAVNEYLRKKTGRPHIVFDTHAVGRYERGVVRWPHSSYREALRAVLGVERDSDLGFYSTRRGKQASQGTGDATAILSSASEEAAEGDFFGHFERARQALIESDNLFGPEQVIPAANGQITLIQRLRQHGEGRGSHGLLAIQAMFAEFAAWLHQDYGNYSRAESWMRCALEWSRDADDPDLKVFILARRAQLAGDAGRAAAQVIDLGTAARSQAPSRSRLAALAETYTAHGYALDGDLDRTERAYDEAHRLLDAAVDLDSPWGVWLDHAYVEVSRHRSLALLGRYEQAAAGFDTAIAELPTGYRRDRGVYLARAARAHAGAEDVEQAAELGMQALRIAMATKSGRILAELSQLTDALEGAGRPAVEFRQAVTESMAYCS